METDAIRLLEVDPALGDFLAEDEFDEARRTLMAPAMTVPKGRWDPRKVVSGHDPAPEVIIAHGILCREVVIGESVCAELVGPGDLLRPWDQAGGSGLVEHTIQWRALEEVRLAVLGRNFAASASRWPTITSALMARAVSRSQGLAVSAAITGTTGLVRRLLMLFSHLADRWGTVTPDGLLLPVPMTHELIGRLIGACRPSVSTALKQLERDGQLARLGSQGWLVSHHQAAVPIAAAG